MVQGELRARREGLRGRPLRRSRALGADAAADGARRGRLARGGPPSARDRAPRRKPEAGQRPGRGLRHRFLGPVCQRALAGCPPARPAPSVAATSTGSRWSRAVSPPAPGATLRAARATRTTLGCLKRRRRREQLLHGLPRPPSAIARDRPRLQRGGHGRRASCAICARSAPDFDVLVVDDGSTDATAAVARAAGRRACSRHAVQPRHRRRGAERATSTR